MESLLNNVDCAGVKKPQKKYFDVKFKFINHTRNIKYTFTLRNNLL